MTHGGSRPGAGSRLYGPPRTISMHTMLTEDEDRNYRHLASRASIPLAELVRREMAGAIERHRCGECGEGEERNEMKRADIAKRRFLSWSVNLAAAEGTLEERAAVGFDRTIELAERGGFGIGISTWRRAERERGNWLREVIALLGSEP